jgi:microcystin-dependent protein
MFVTGMIMMWSGTIATIPSGWVLCDGSNSTPDLRNRFIIGANADDAGVAKTNVTGSATQTGGSKDAIVVSHTHTATVTDPGHTHSYTRPSGNQTLGAGTNNAVFTTASATTVSNTTGISVSNSTEGSSGTNQNLPPYYALAFIMKS